MNELTKARMRAFHFENMALLMNAHSLLHPMHPVESTMPHGACPCELAALYRKTKSIYDELTAAA